MLNAFCLDNCPVSFYAVNTTVPRPTTTTSTTVTTEPTSTAATTSTSASTSVSTATSVMNHTSSLPTGSISSTSSMPPIPVNHSNVTTALPSNSPSPTFKLECLSCAEGCARCVGPSPGQCLECLEGYNKTVTGSCKLTPVRTFKMTAPLVIVSLSLVAIAAFFIVFGALQMCEPDSCIHGNRKYRASRTTGDVEAFRDSKSSSKKISDLRNGVRYKNGADKIRQPLLSSGSEDDLES